MLSYYYMMVFRDKWVYIYTHIHTAMEKNKRSPVKVVSKISPMLYV